MLFRSMILRLYGQGRSLMRGRVSSARGLMRASSRRGGAEAMVRAGAERQMPVGLAADVELVGPLQRRFVTIQNRWDARHLPNAQRKSEENNEEKKDIKDQSQLWEYQVKDLFHRLRLFGKRPVQVVRLFSPLSCGV